MSGVAARAIVLGVAALCATTTRAQSSIDAAAGQGPGSFDIERLRPGLDRAAILDVEGGAVSDDVVDAALWVNGAFDPLTVRLNGKSSPVVEQRASAHVVASWAPTKSFSLGAEIPVVLWQQGSALVPGIAGTNPVASFGLDDVRVVPKLAFLDGPVDLAVAAHITLPTSVPRHRYIGDGLPTVTPELDASAKFGALRIAADAGALLRAPSSFGGVSQGEEVTARVGAAYAIGPVEIAATINQALTVYPNPGANNPGEALLGVTAHLGALDAFAAVGTATLAAPGTPLARAIVGVSYAFGAGEGAARDASGRDANAANIASRDSDGDGVLDVEDRCPQEKGPKETRGCPDADGDGVPDVDDKCYAVAGRADHQGCPLTESEDRDHDGIENEKDRCPDRAGDAAHDGCPETARVDGDHIEVQSAIAFAKAKITPESAAQLDDVAALLNAHPEIKRVRIAAHTEQNAKHRMDLLLLSQKQASEVKSYLLKKGVAKERVEAVGYGGSKPAARGDENRRVELVIVDRAG